MAFHNIPPNGFPDIPDMEELEAVVKDVNSLKTSVSGLATDVSNLSDNKANQITIAPFFDPETSYEVGDLVYYNGLSYRCTNDHEGEWDADDFAATTVSNELATLKSGLINVGDIKGRSGLSINFDDLLEYGNGIFSISTNEDTEAPDSNINSYYVLQSSFYSDNSYVMQIAVGSWNTNFKVYLRKRTSGTWSQWKSIELI